MEKNVCIPLSKRIDIGIVAPAAWEKTKLCKRPLSWYFVSRKKGMTLVVSSKDLSEYGLLPQIILKNIKFRPPALPNNKKKLALIKRSSYSEAKPDLWDNLEKDPAAHEKWMKVMGIPKGGFKELFLGHCANHANFLEPEYYVRDGDRKIPYSIGKTIHICSACLEFFNIIGEKFHKKFVVPCPGAVIYAGVSANKYIEVETVSIID